VVIGIWYWQLVISWYWYWYNWYLVLVLVLVVGVGIGTGSTHLYSRYVRVLSWNYLWVREGRTGNEIHLFSKQNQRKLLPLTLFLLPTPTITTVNNIVNLRT
jgi:hypothetical protein